MQATFKCLVSGNTVTFVHQVDIDSMKGHPDYEQVIEAAPKVEEEEAPKAEAVKKAGRPRKLEAEVH